MLANFIAYWLIGLPAGYVLCFKLGWGALGVWIGLCGGLMMIGSALLVHLGPEEAFMSTDMRPGF